MKPCSSFMAMAICLSVLALHARPVASICQSCLVDLNCKFDNNTPDVAIKFTICNPDAQVCVNLDNLRDIDCPCSNGEDCQSGRCEGPFGATCRAKLEDGQFCNEDSDCLSRDCNFQFRCVSRAQEPTSAPIAQEPTSASTPVAQEPTSAPIAQKPTSAPIAQLRTPSSSTDVYGDGATPSDATTSSGSNDGDKSNADLVVGGIIGAIAFMVICILSFVCNDNNHNACVRCGELVECSITACLGCIAVFCQLISLG